MENQFHENMKAMLLKAFDAPPPPHASADLKNIKIGLRCLIEADGLKAFYEAAEKARGEGIAMTDFVMALIQYHTLELALLLQTDGDTTEVVDTMVTLYDMYLKRSVKLMRTVAKNRKEAEKEKS